MDIHQKGTEFQKDPTSFEKFQKKKKKVKKSERSSSTDPPEEKTVSEKQIAYEREEESIFACLGELEFNESDSEMINAHIL